MVLILIKILIRVWLKVKKVNMYSKNKQFDNHLIKFTL